MDSSTCIANDLFEHTIWWWWRR